jgi:hypothetical protein
MARTPQEVFQHHAEALGAGDLDEIVADYADDAVFITPAAVLRGRAEAKVRPNPARPDPEPCGAASAPSLPDPIG